MSSAKTERLVNLTMALLATPRYLQKSEIFRKVAGYTGSQETKERMFERDKDDLRSMGIEIEVASHDPLFEDEPGYRIKKEKFRLPIDTFDAEELSILSTALGLWSESGLSALTESTARRLGASSDSAEPLNSYSKDFAFDAEGLVELSRALAARSSVTFEYRKEGDSQAELRNVNPLGLSGWRGSWYLVAEDLNRRDIRVFNLTRVVSAINISNKRNTYEIPSDFDLRDYLIMYRKNDIRVEALIRKGSANEIRVKASSISEPKETRLQAEWDLVTYHAESLESALREALWFADVLVIKSPESLKVQVIDSLKKTLVQHG